MRVFSLVLLFFSFSLSAEKLVTPSYEIEVAWNCGEGYVSCENIEFKVTNLISLKVETFIGRSNHSICADGVTPCKFQGYEFNSGELRFSLFNRGLLEITKSPTESILNEEGKWHY